VSVRIAAAEDEVDVARLAPGDFFGEMSLLTGEPRSATVVAVTEATIYEIRKDDMAALLDRNPGAAEVLSEAAAERRVLSSAAVLKATPQALEAEKATIAGQILARMTKFFGGRRRRPVTA
jgi:potassium-dependent mechanosensitive channel